jgi:hypothetical protein
VGGAYLKDARPDFWRGVHRRKQQGPRFALASVDYIVNGGKREPAMVQIPVAHARAKEGHSTTRVDSLHSLPATGTLCLGEILWLPS